MRAPRYLSIAAALAAIPVPGLQAQTRDATAILSAARDALGGDKRLSAVKTFVLTGRTRQVQGDNLVPIELEISCELPAKFVRKDEIPAQKSGPTTVGFNGDELIQIPPQTPLPLPLGRPDGQRVPTPEQLDAARRTRIIGAKQEFARLALGMFASSFSSYPLNFTYVGQAEAPQGMADVLEATGPANLTMRFFVYRDTHLPVMVSWQGGSSAARDAVPGQPPENRIYFADYREVDGLRLPFRLRRALGPDTIEETTFDRFRVNAKIDPKKFEVRK